MEKQVYPVIHHLDYGTSRMEAGLAFSCGADGVFLISHRGEDTDLLQIAHDLKQAHPTKKIGLNLLGFDCVDAYHICVGLGLDMMWTDRPGITSRGIDARGAHLSDLHLRFNNRPVEVFASVAFKYQPHEPNPALAAELAFDEYFIPTTSGAGTGIAPDVEKIASMSDATSGCLAVASGMTCENVNVFKPYVSHFLVSTGISRDSYHFDPRKVEQFCSIVHDAS